METMIIEQRFHKLLHAVLSLQFCGLERFLLTRHNLCLSMVCCDRENSDEMVKNLRIVYHEKAVFSVLRNYNFIALSSSILTITTCELEKQFSSVLAICNYDFVGHTLSGKTSIKCLKPYNLFVLRKTSLLQFIDVTSSQPFNTLFYCYLMPIEENQFSSVQTNYI